MGDFNLPDIDLVTMTSPSGCRNSNILIALAFSRNLVQVAWSHTRVTDTISSLIDLLFLSNDLFVPDDRCVVVNEISDHPMIVFDCRVFFPISHLIKKKKFGTTTVRKTKAFLDFLELAFDTFAGISVSRDYDVNQLCYYFSGYRTYMHK